MLTLSSERLLQVAKVVDQFQGMVSGLRSSAQQRMRRRQMNRAGFPGALAIMLKGPGRDLLQAAFCDAGWGLTIADTFAVALDPVSDRFPIILYERELSERWREAISLISSQPARPYLILLSSSSDRNLWDELVRCGGFEILRTPVDRLAVQRAVKSGWSLWRNQQKLRLAAAEGRP